jgi:hypothetical protein
MQACNILLGRPWQFDKDSMHQGRSNQYSFMHHDKKIVLHPMSPDAIVKDDVAKTSKLKSQEHAKSENHIAAKELVKQGNKNTKSAFIKKNEITLKGSCFLATRSNVNELIASTSDCYALVCKDALISLHDMQHSLPPAVSNIFAGVF